MPQKSWIEREKKEKKYDVRKVNRCWRCGRPRGYIRKFGVCRICLRELARKRMIPGMVKSSW